MTRIPAQPLFETAAYVAGKPLHKPNCRYCLNETSNVDSCLRSQPLADLLGVSRKTIDRWKHYGVTLEQADHAATRLGYNPIAIWGLYWDDPEHNVVVENKALR